MMNITPPKNIGPHGQPYTQSFYDYHRELSARSARRIVPLVLELIPCLSVIDVGCGTGVWLKTFQEKGVTTVRGVDGDYVDRASLEISQEYFSPYDLSTPYVSERQYDLVVSLEVAEHLPEACAKGFVKTLVDLGPVVLFSAAIPGQIGTNHVNEQWPDYWAECFKEHGYVAIDCVRKHIWNDESVEVWYAQNTLIFASLRYLEANPLLKREYEATNSMMLSVAHPKLFNAANQSLAGLTDLNNKSLKEMLRTTSTVAKNNIKKRLQPLTIPAVSSGMREK